MVSRGASRRPVFWSRRARVEGFWPVAGEYPPAGRPGLTSGCLRGVNAVSPR